MAEENHPKPELHESDKSEPEVRTLHVPFTEGVKLGCALAIGFVIGQVIIILAVVLLFGATISSLIGNAGG
jgi:hypothetical protein